MRATGAIRATGRIVSRELMGSKVRGILREPEVTTGLSVTVYELSPDGPVVMLCQPGPGRGTSHADPTPARDPAPSREGSDAA